MKYQLEVKKTFTREYLPFETLREAIFQANKLERKRFDSIACLIVTEQGNPVPIYQCNLWR